MDDRNKKNRKQKMQRIALLCSLGLALSLGSVVVTNALAEELFEITAPSAQADMKISADASIKRSSVVKIKYDLLNDPSVGTADSGLVLNLFPDTQLIAFRDRVESRSENSYTWFGRLQNVEMGSVVLSVVDGVMAGNISYLGGFFQIRSIGDNYYAIYEIDQSTFKDEAEPIKAPGNSGQDIIHQDNASGEQTTVEKNDPSLLGPEAMSDDGSIIDVFVAYTATAANASSNILSEIQLAVDETNQAYINSGVSHRVRLAGTGQVTYTETGSAYTDLPRLRDTSDGYMDIVHTWRNNYHADQVSLIVESLDACGIGYFMDPISTSFDTNAFTVVARSCATGYYSFGHEIGHNMGARHDCYVDSAVTPSNYNHGFVHIGSSQSTSWRTIMAYRNACEAAGFSDCQRIQYFSNPSVSYNGNATGTSGTTGCIADVHAALADSDYTVSNFRDGVCTKYGYLERISVFPGSSNSFLYTRPYSTSNYYTYFSTNDSKVVKAAIKALPNRAQISVQGDQSCFDTSTDYGGKANYIIVSP